MLDAATTTRPLRVVDLFCGACGSSSGAEAAAARLGRAVELIGVNHWATALDTAGRNHPGARLIQADLHVARPEQIVPDRWADLLLASPTCTYFSSARGGLPVSDQQRMDPWGVVAWAASLTAP
ncbi:MAG: DNA cytosine methyltransferase, partial [Alphaproteobacteria bacterium]|nr:DNA cytosine methyltransferase [Alphaproteobacteria bacterium]